MQILTEFIDEAEINTKEFYEYVSVVGDDELAEFISSINEIIEASYISNRTDKKFNFVANTTMSGFSFPCGELECKLTSIYTLARNAILYADTIYIQNPFEQYSKFSNFNDKLRNDIINDLILLDYIKPLLKEEIFKIAVTKIHFCQDCNLKFQENYLTPFKNNLETFKPLIEDFLLTKIDFHVNYNEKIELEISGTNDLLNHPMVINFVEFVPDSLKFKAKKGKRIKLTPKEVSDIGAHMFLFREIEKNIAMQDFYSSQFSCHVLTDREFDIQLLKLLNKDEYTRNSKRGDILKNLNHFVPFIEDIPLENLIKFRKNEGEAFEVYRDKINNIVKKENLDIKDSKLIYEDEIRPELNKINLSIKNNKKLLWGNIQSNIILASTYVSTTLFTGILPTNMEKVIASVGGFGFAKNITQDALKLIKKPEARNNEMYFLWKLSKKKQDPNIRA